MTDRVDSEHSMNLARRWFTAGGGNVAMADDLFSENVRTMGAGRRGQTSTQDTRAAGGLPGLTAAIEDMFSAHDKIVTRLVWRGTPTGSYGASGLPASRCRSEALPFGVSKTARRRKSRRYRISSRF